MPLIAHIGHRSPRVRALHAAIYGLLILGSVTMVYPFALMIAGSTKSMLDESDLSLIPPFLRSDRALYQKHVEALFNEKLATMQKVLGVDAPGFDALDPPTVEAPALVGAWHAFLQERPPPPYASALGYLWAPVTNCHSLMLRRFRRELVERFDGDIHAMNRALETEFISWNTFLVMPEDTTLRRSTLLDTPFNRARRDFKLRQPAFFSYFYDLESYYTTGFLKTRYTRDIAEYNRVHGTRYPEYESVRLTRRAPEGTPAERAGWEDFVRNSLHLAWIRVAPEAAPDYRHFLLAKYGSVDAVNRRYRTAYGSTSEIPLPAALPPEGLPRADWNQFITGWRDRATGTLHTPALEHLRVTWLGFDFQDYLADRYATPQAMNQALGTQVPSFSDVRPPLREADYLAFMERRGELRLEFVKRNFVTVIEYLLIHGRGVTNTVIYCLLAVLAALIVNPLAAYALSRYRLPVAYKILLFLLLTMAFPPMVTQIPVFLMLRDLQLLNTFAALILPGLAHGYSIFLLKGFFDSLPRELYESAALDGAGEWILFWQITMSLSKPILAVIALQAFNLAYANFMFALLICQDESMWTLMVWLYQLQQRSGTGVVYASLLIASIPTFIVFLFAQNIIMRGIIVPVEK